MVAEIAPSGAFIEVDDNNLGKENQMNNLIWLVGAIVIVLAILSFFGFR